MFISYFFIVNPYSNNGKTRSKWLNVFLPEIQKKFPNACWAFTEKPGHASLLAMYAKQNRFHVVVAVGGDGTINEIVNGLMDNPLLDKDDFNPQIFGFQKESTLQTNVIPKFACIPAGTGCDFIRSLNIPNRFDSALHIIEKNESVLSDVGIVTYRNLEVEKKRYFINISGCGLNGTTAKYINNSKKSFGSTLSFWLAAAWCVIKNKTYQVMISYDDEKPIAVDLQVLFVCNAKYCGGGMLVGSQAKIDDELFHINQIKKIGKIKTLLLTKRIYSGNFLGLEEFITLRQAKKITVMSPLHNSDVLIECDGEQPGTLPAEFSLAPQKIEVLANL